MAKRVFELAREMGVTSKLVLDKCRAEGLEIKNHMSTVSAGLEATVREWFTEGQGDGTAVETSDHVDLPTAREEARKARYRRTKAEPPEAEATAEEGAEAVAEAPAEPVIAVEEQPAAEPAAEQATPPTAPAAANETPGADEPDETAAAPQA